MHFNDVRPMQPLCTDCHATKTEQETTFTGPEDDYPSDHCPISIEITR